MRPVAPLTRVRRSEAGFSAVEMAVATAITVMVFGAFTSSVTDAIGVSVQTVSSVTLQEEARRILDRLRRDIAMTGQRDSTVDPTGVGLPAVFSNGTAPAGITEFSHDQTTLGILASGFTPAPVPPEPFNPAPFVAPGNELEPLGFREFVFRLPRDVTGDGRMVTTGGAIEWGPELFGYLVVPRINDADGLCDLVRRTVFANGTISDEIVCRQIAAATFDTVATKEILPVGAVEVHLHLLRRNERGALQRLHVSTTLVMRN